MSRLHELVFRALHRELAANGDTPDQFTASGGTTSTVVCAALTESNDYWNGALLRWDSGANAGLWSNVGDFVSGTDTLVLDDVLPVAAANGDEFTLFLGGKFASDVEVRSLATSPLVNVTGFEIANAAAMNGEGTGTLRFDAATGFLTWQPPREDEGNAVTVSALAIGGRAIVYGAGTSLEQLGKFLVLERTAAALPVADAADDVSLDLVPGGFVARVTGAEAAAGVTLYRPVAVKNMSSGEARELAAWCAPPFPAAAAAVLAADLGTGAGTLEADALTGWGASGWVYNATKDDARYFYDRSGRSAFVADPGGGARGLTAVAWDEGDELVPLPWFDIGQGVDSGGGEFEDPATRETPPSGVVFSCPRGPDEALPLGDAAPGSVTCIWLRIEVPAGHRPLEGGRIDLRVRAQVTEER